MGVPPDVTTVTLSVYWIVKSITSPTVKVPSAWAVFTTVILAEVVSMVIESDGDDGDSLPASSTNFVVMVWDPSPRIEVVIVYTLAEQVPVPTKVAPS